MSNIFYIQFRLPSAQAKIRVTAAENRPAADEKPAEYVVYSLPDMSAPVRSIGTASQGDPRFFGLYQATKLKS
jgi:hypothetical protein